jgi:hypothetical protein
MASYLYLVDDITQACENDGTEFQNYIPKMVNRAEERMTRDLDDYGLVTYTSVAISANNNIITLPVGTRVIKNFTVTLGASGKSPILQRTDEFINDYWPDATSTTDIPVYYARRDNTTIMIAPTTNATYDAEIVHVDKPVALTTATPNNYFSDFCYDALFNASMVEAMMFMKDYPTAQLFEQRYAQSLQTLQNQARRTRRDDMEMPASPAGADNNLRIGAN